MKTKDETLKSFEPIVFLNYPINTEDEDIIGISSAIKSIESAIEQGATMIGVLADYGTGKSSLTDTLSSSNKKNCPIRINMWDSLYINSGVIKPKVLQEDIPTLTKSFLYQLASSSVINKCNHSFARYINKKLNRNYGLISFSTKSIWQIIILILAALFYLLYLVFSNANLLFIYDLVSNLNIPHALTISNALITFAPVFIIFTIIAAAFALSATTFTFSHWKDQTKRSQDVNDVIDVFSDIATKLCKCKKKRNLIIVEDLDRIGDKETVIDFLRELYRFQNFLTDKHRRKIAFIVAVKSEPLLEKSLPSVQKTDDENYVFDKIFDYTICLKPLHFEDYENIILSIIKNDKPNRNLRLGIREFYYCLRKTFKMGLSKQIISNLKNNLDEEIKNINSNSTNKAKLERLLDIEINDRLPSSFNWLLHGENLTIRNLKDRLNQAVSLMITLKNKDYRLNSRSIINFNTCAAVTYLEQTYGIVFYKTIENETFLGEVIRNSYITRNKVITREEKIINITSLLSFINNISKGTEQTRKSFKDDLAKMIAEGTIDEDFRMYFYNYPRNSKIRTTDEKDLYRLLFMPNLYPSDKQLNEKVSRIVAENRQSNIIIDCLEKISDQELSQFPQVILDNEFIFKSAMDINTEKVLYVFNSHANWIGNFSESIYTFERISCFSSQVREDFYRDYFPTFKKYFKTYTDSLKIQVRAELVILCNEFISIFHELFVPEKDEQGNIKKDSLNMNIITEVEINAMDLDIAFDLINIDKIDQKNIMYISKCINSIALTKSQYAKGEIIYLAATNKKIPIEIIGSVILDFLTINKSIQNELFSHVTFWIQATIVNRDNELKRCTEYISSLNPDQVPNEYLEGIDSLHIYNGLSDPILIKLWENKLLGTYLCSMYAANQLDEIKYDDAETCKAICNACNTINRFNDAIIHSVRLAILRQDSNLAAQYFLLFSDTYPLITCDELNAFPEFADAIKYISTAIIDDNNASNIIDFMNIAKRNSDQCYLLFERLFINGSIDDYSTIRKLLDGFDYTIVKYKNLLDEQKEEIVLSITDAMNLTDANNCIAYMKLTNCLTTSLEKIASENQPDEYIELINELNQCSNYTIDWITDQGEAVALNTAITDELLNKKLYSSYVVGKTLWNREFVFEPDIVPFDSYMQIFQKCTKVFEIMKESQEFISEIVKRGNFDGLTNERIKAIRVPRHPFTLVKQAFEVLSRNEIEEYLNSLGDLTEQDSMEFFSYLMQNEDAREQLGSFPSRQRAYSLLRKRSDRSRFTELMHDYYPEENYRE